MDTIRLYRIARLQRELLTLTGALLGLAVVGSIFIILMVVGSRGEAVDVAGFLAWGLCMCALTAQVGIVMRTWSLSREIDGRSWPAILAVLPPMSLLILALLMERATRMLRAGGVTVGVMGASPEVIEQLESGDVRSPDTA